ncbi:MAG: hypothetical protein COW01_11410 [Bdellovibrionales bacterium CG12_big_fil_rev_8_21_14_0_65_38_15]|nr:MAG: hypothetical protein COW79_11440 [Bdellovibrionales bacterium CG22_combo_CG10-13_8_21_14_all_38_13]PIQ54218.1 MAG: hypothetical protein COW01_11410 [Bdellovibrionales bacterium CG12_big_fil_rev_8_21_14_0_65_38_15]PIR29276.1 MAG: hypothetical protein COV38_11055 [Bdellovibrionales bacterium CG11_big_fil_rev_8_21_14_0_20_38_13]
MKKIIVLISLLCFSSVLLAKDWVINDQHTQVQFKIGYMGVMEVSGLFTNVRGKFSLDEKTMKASDIIFQIATKSVQTHNEKRDRHLKKSDFFYAAQFPWIEATLASIDLNHKKINTTISLNIKENLKNLPVVIEVIGIKNDPWDQSKKSLFLKLKGEINRKDFGLNWNKTLDNGDLLIDNKVEFSVNIEANPSDQKLAFSRFFLPTGQKTKYVQTESNSLPIDSIEEITEEEALKTAPETTPKDHTNPASFIIGFIIFIAITVLSIYLKIKLQFFLEKKKERSKIVSEIISDLVLLLFVIVAFMLTAPLMGYGK